MIKLKNPDDIKFYLYISDTKLDMLYQQITSSTKEKSSFGCEINLHVVKLSSKKERENEDIKDDKLKIVIKALNDAKLVGSIDNPNQYFKGTLPMRWGTLRDWGRPSDESPLVYFGGNTESTMFGLGGSSKHVIGNSGSASTDSRSSAPSIIGEILSGLDMPLAGWRTAPRLRDMDHHGTYEAIKWANRNLSWAPEQNMEFYAKTLLKGDYLDDDGQSIRVLLGSPIYVALSGSNKDFSYC